VKRIAYIGLGSNQGEVAEALNSAIESLRSIEQTDFIAVSPYYRSAPVDAPGPDYLNAVAKVETALEPYALLLHLLDIELMLDASAWLEEKCPPQCRSGSASARDMIIQSTPLTLPHPRLHLRAFVLRPLLDLDPGIRYRARAPPPHSSNRSKTSASSHTRRRRRPERADPHAGPDGRRGRRPC